MQFKKISISFLLAILFPVVLNAQEIQVSSMEELQNAVSNATPGTTILLTDGIYKGGEISLAKSGTPGKSVEIRAAKTGKAVLHSPVTVNGNFISIVGLQFRGNANIVIKGEGCRLSQCDFTDVRQGKWVKILPGSKNIEIDYNSFQNKKINTELERDAQLMQVIVRNKNEHHHIHHNLFKDIPQGSGNGFETLQLITEGNPFDPPPGACNSVIENNLFVHCNGEAEVISVKSNGNLLQNNTFQNCRGSLVLRHGDNNVVNANFFFGEKEPGSGGVRLQGTGQVVSNNYFYGLQKFGIGMMDGTPDDLYIRVENAGILFNTFVNCQNNLVVGLNHSKHPNGAVPKDCTIAGNIFSAENNEPFIQFVQNDQPENWTWKNNIAFGGTTENVEQGIQQENPHLRIDENKIALPTEKTPSVQMSLKQAKSDLFNQPRKHKTTVGAIVFPFKKEEGFLLNETMTGPEAKLQKTK